MSGIYIAGMEIPRGCSYCKIKKRNGKKMVCPLSNKEWDILDPMSADFRLSSCPLIPVPDHGRLISAFDTVKTLCDKGLYMHAEIVSDMPTIIPADKEDLSNAD